jgi:hypothetical protein
MTWRREFLITACAAIAGLAISPLLPSPARPGIWSTGGLRRK